MNKESIVQFITTCTEKGLKQLVELKSKLDRVLGEKASVEKQIEDIVTGISEPVKTGRKRDWSLSTPAPAKEKPPPRWE